MKKFIILALIMLSTSVSFGQEDLFNRWAISGEFGVHSVSDESAIVTENYNHFGLDARYNINTIVGVGVRGGFDNIQLNSLEGDYVKMDYARLNAEATISLFEILKLRHKNINFLLHGGPGLSLIDTDNGYNGRVFNVAGGMTFLVKVSKGLALKVDYTSAIHLSQDRTLDGVYDISNAGINSVVDNLSVGAVFYIGKRHNEVQHADWYVPAPIVPVVPVINNITNVTKEITKVVTEPCDCKVKEFIFFEHDKYDVLQSERNSLAQVVDYLNENPDSKLIINGFASPTNSSAEYNLQLSSNRVNSVASKLNLMGIDSSRISKFPKGKDFNYSDEEIQPMGRRVELIIE